VGFYVVCAWTIGASRLASRSGVTGRGEMSSAAVVVAPSILPPQAGSTAPRGKPARTEAAG
jgi:hypothetical protein